MVDDLLDGARGDCHVRPGGFEPSLRAAEPTFEKVRGPTGLRPAACGVPAFEPCTDSEGPPSWW